MKIKEESCAKQLPSNPEGKIMTEAAAAPAMGAADISEFDTVTASDNGSQMELKNPKTGEVLRHVDGRPFTVNLRGRDSKIFRDAARTINDKRIQASVRSKMPVLSATIEKDDIDLLVAATISWDVVIGGKVPPSKPEEYRQAYGRYPWMREQCEQWLELRANFIKG